MGPRIVVIGLSGYSIFMDVNHFHQSGETLVAGDVFFEPGGKGFNQAVAAKRLGGDVCFISSVGNDEYGRLCEERLIKEGVNSCLIKKDGINTAFAVILTDDKGENQVTVYRGASRSLTAEDIERHEELIKAADVLLLQMEVPLEANKKALEIANRHGVTTILNPAPPWDFDFKLINENTIITPNEFEARAIFGLSPDEAVLDNKKIIGKYQEHLKRMIITLGEKGCAMFNEGVVRLIPALKVKALNTTGAGDVFNGALAVRIGSGESFIDSARFAVIASGLSVEKYFALESFPRREEVIQMLKEQNGLDDLR